MLRTALALVVSMSVSAPAFAQQPENKVKDSIGRIKDYITAYDSGTGTMLAKVGGKTMLYSFAAYGAATAALLPVNGVANPKRISLSGWYRIAPNSHFGWVAKQVKDTVGLAGATVGATLVAASALTFIAQHVWYGWLGHADQNAELTAEHQAWTNYFANTSADQIFADAQANPELGDRLVQLAGALHEVK